jgi:hypothetical protein
MIFLASAIVQFRPNSQEVREWFLGQITQSCFCADLMRVALDFVKQATDVPAKIAVVDKPTTIPAYDV